MIIRPAQPDDIPAIARVHVDSWRTTYAGIVDASYLSALSYPEHEVRHRRYIAHPGTSYLVADVPGDGVVGFVTGGPERSGDKRFAGELYAVYILQHHQRGGIGRAMLREWAVTLRARGIDSAMLWVLQQNTPAIAFYERLGGRRVGEQSIKIGGRPFIEIAYGWEDSTSIAQ